MPLKTCIVVLCVLYSDALMTSRDFHRLVAPACFKHGPEDQDVSPRNIKTFIELVDKVEKLHQLDDAADTASLLLRRFAMPYMRLKRTEKGYMFLVDKDEEARAAIFEVILRSAPRLIFKEDSFTSHEKCALFFMLSHSIEHRNNGAGILAYIENGVVSPIVHPEGNSAISLSAALKGISASKYASRESTEALLAILRPYSGVVPEGHTVVDHIYGPTFAGLLGASVLWRNTSVVPHIGRNGVWTSPLCPREFKLSPKVADITDAELSGTIDGFILNVVASRISKQRRRPFSLSQLMSTYYSSRGIRELVPEFSSGVSFCNRGKVFHKLFSTERLTEQTLAVARLSNAAEALPLKEVIETYAIVPSVKKFAQELEHLVTHPPSTCQEVQRQVDKGTCQTQSNVLLLLDPVSGNPKFDSYQRKLSAYLSEKLLENNPNSRVSMSSSSLADNPHVLKLFFSSSYKQKNPSCQVNRPDTGCVDCQEADIWRAVNGTWNSLLEDDVEMAAGTVTPSKVVIYFKFNDFKSNEEDLQNVIRSLRKSHKDLYIFVVGPKPEIVEKFRADVKDAVVIIPQAADDRVMQRIASELAHEICQTPAIVHCKNCLTDHLQVSSIHQTFLAPHSSYSWAVYPDELNRKPSLVNISVSSESLPLKICYERQNSTHQRVPIEETNCHETNTENVFEKSFNDLCDETKCDMIHFKVVAQPRKPGAPFKECNHQDCKFPDETRVEIGYVAEFEDDLLQTSNRLDTYRYPTDVPGNPRNNPKDYKSKQISEQSHIQVENPLFESDDRKQLKHHERHESYSPTKKSVSNRRKEKQNVDTSNRDKAYSRERPQKSHDSDFQREYLRPETERTQRVPLRVSCSTGFSKILEK